MGYNGVLEKKLFLFEQKLADLHAWEIGAFDEFKNNSLVRSAVERALQVCIEIMIDVAERIVALEQRTPGETSFDNMKILQSCGGIESAEKYKKMVQFRNFIVHRYEYVEPEILYDIVTNRLLDFREYIAEIRHFMRRKK